MKAHELRLGNLLSYNGHVVEVSNIGVNGFETHKTRGIIYGSCDLADYGPIPLTEQWLLDFGFERGVDYWFKGDVILDISPEGLSYRFHYNIIKYAHRLQNLYFALTGEKLQL